MPTQNTLLYSRPYKNGCTVLFTTSDLHFCHFCTAYITDDCWRGRRGSFGCILHIGKIHQYLNYIYSLRPIILFTSMDISRHIIVSRYIYTSEEYYGSEVVEYFEFKFITCSPIYKRSHSSRRNIFLSRINIFFHENAKKALGFNPLIEREGCVQI
jgi:hypothetical protein